jgi:hypothetical protein
VSGTTCTRPARDVRLCSLLEASSADIASTDSVMECAVLANPHLGYNNLLLEVRIEQHAGSICEKLL